MHEFGIVKEIIQSVEYAFEKQKKGYSRVEEIQIELGQLMGIQQETMEFLLKEMSKGTAMENAKIKVRSVAPTVECSQKHKSKLKLKLEKHFHDFPTHELKCPKCKKPLKVMKGDDCIIKKIIFE